MSNEDYPEFNREYDDNFPVGDNYIKTLPDLQNGPCSLIRGAKTAIQHVGISNFVMPIDYEMKDGNKIKLETSVTGSVSLEAEKKGINMSRIMRTFYEYRKDTFSIDLIEKVLAAYKDKLETHDARISMKFRYPMIIPSLRSANEGYQYYNIAIEVLKDSEDNIKKIIHLDYVYSSTCPCSLELSEHARRERNQLATPHSQRSIARVSVELLPGAFVWFEDLIDTMRGAIPTETQVMVKREDEQAFAELNAANPIFVEDAVRSMYEGLENLEGVGDFRAIATHMESLHSHDAISIITKGDTFTQESYDPHTFAALAFPHVA